MSYLHGKFVWFEHMSGDTAQARKFYEALLGWHTELTPMGGPEPYPLIMNGGEGIGGFRSAPRGAPAHWTSYLSVADVDASYQAALAAGAKALLPPTDFAAVGRGASVADPTGAAVSLWKGAQGDRADAAKTASGDWLWNELSTPDELKALAFYEAVFGYTHDTMDMGAQGTYYLLKKYGSMRGGLMRSPMPGLPAMWMPYVAVADCDATAAKAKTLGAQLMVAPSDIPNVGRFAALTDPQGAALAFMKPVG
jgi:uncharacterized protein